VAEVAEFEFLEVMISNKQFLASTVEMAAEWHQLGAILTAGGRRLGYSGDTRLTGGWFRAISHCRRTTWGRQLTYTSDKSGRPNRLGAELLLF
jgi:hypothetical protein